MRTAEKLATSIGNGLIAGLAGTAAMTASTTIEARLRHRAPSSAPARATAKALGIASFDNDTAQARFNDLAHWAYGTSWGLARALLAAAGLPPRAATLAHGAAIWGTAQVALPAWDITPPAIYRTPPDIAIDALHHTIYTITTGITYELLSNGRGVRPRCSAIALLGTAGCRAA